jgi:hypothetical protein
MASSGVRLRSANVSQWIALLVGLASLFVAARWVAHGSIARDVLIILMALSPAALYFGLVRPIIFPYGLYLALLPFDSLLRTSGGTLTKLLGAVTGALLFFYCIRVRRFAPPAPPVFIAGALLLWMAVTALWSPNAGDSLRAIGPYALLLLLYAAVSITRVSRRDFIFVLYAVVVSSAIGSLLAISMFHHAPPATPASPDTSRLVLESGRRAVTDPNQFADSFIFPAAIALMMTLRTRLISGKLLGLAGLCSIVAAILLSGSREALLALTGVLLYFFWKVRYRIQLLTIAAVGAVALAPLAAIVIARFQNALATGGAGRTSIWAIGLQVAKRYWLFGSGVGSFPDEYNRFYLSVYQQYPMGWGMQPHNVALRFLVETGIVGIALLIAFFAANFFMLRSIGKDHPFYDYRVTIEAAFVGIIIVSFFIDFVDEKYSWLLFATAAQLAYQASTLKRIEKTWSPNSLARDLQPI